jgi:hypothetical protein
MLCLDRYTPASYSGDTAFHSRLESDILVRGTVNVIQFKERWYISLIQEYMYLKTL